MANTNSLLKISTLCLLFTFTGFNAFSQNKKIDWKTDTLNTTSAKNRVEKYRTYFEKDQRSITPTIFMPVEKLKAILDVCAQNNIKNVQFLLAVIRLEDTATYFPKRPALAKADKQKLINRPTLIVKVPRRAAVQLAGTRQAFQKFMVSMLALGHIYVDKEFGFADEDYIYFDIGFICPPPSDCAFDSDN
jgi:hypothetical protein